MEHKRAKSVIESLLFVWGEPLSLGKIASILNMSKKDIRELIAEMTDEYEQDSRGIRIVEADKHYQLASAPENHEWLQVLCTKSKSKGLSHSSLEVLAIVAYRQPITRSEIEQVRGVKCEKPINHLLERELIEEQGRLDRIGKPIIYGTTKMFLTAFGFTSLKDLPPIDEFHNIEFIFGSDDEEDHDQNEVADTGTKQDEADSYDKQEEKDVVND